MSKPQFTLAWEVQVLGTVTIVGRPYSSTSKSKGYSKNQVRSHLEQAVLAARKMVEETLKIVRDCHRVAYCRATGSPDPPVMPAALPLVIRMANDHFKIPHHTIRPRNAAAWVTLLEHVEQVFMLIKAGICGHFIIVDLESGLKPIGFGGVGIGLATLLDPADPEGLHFADRGPIQINFIWCTTRSTRRIARTIIHEASHRFAGTRDRAYKARPIDYAALTHAQARANADSFACFAYYLWKNGAFGLN
jgi:hypothetical protein